ncbi:MAG: hypothetical protein QXW62_05525 [Candidatus Methanomethylicaceae archaeon]|nr:hypothetical protein [Candidatus Verstraetearchaeota archaeon]
MPKIVNTLWFETLSSWNQPFIDTPFCPITPRQLLLIIIGALIGYSIYKNFFIENFLRIGISSIPFIFSIIIASKKIKTIPPEKYLLYLIFRNYKKKEEKIRKNKEENRIEKIPEEVKHVLRKFIPPLKSISIKLNSPIEITGVLRNPKTNMPMSNTLFYASIGELILTGYSNEKGNYKIKLNLENPGSYHMILAVQGFDTPVDSILINVKDD